MLAAIAVPITNRRRFPISTTFPRHWTFGADNVIAISQHAGTRAGIEYRGSAPGKRFTKRNGSPAPQLRARADTRSEAVVHFVFRMIASKSVQGRKEARPP